MLTQENLAGRIARMSIHQRIKQLREAKGLSMEALAKLVGVSAYQTVQQWEREGGTAPKRDRMAVVAAALGTTVAYLVSGNDASTAPPGAHSSGPSSDERTDRPAPRQRKNSRPSPDGWERLNPMQKKKVEAYIKSLLDPSSESGRFRSD